MPKPLVDINQYRDNCGFGLTANIKGVASHELMLQGIASLQCMAHRGAINADGKTGDGCGINIQIPDKFFQEESKKLSISLANNYAVGVVLLSEAKATQQKQQGAIAKEVAKFSGMTLAGWREVPINKDVLGGLAQKSLPSFWHFFINCDIEDTELAQAKLFLVKRAIISLLSSDSRESKGKVISKSDDKQGYLISLSFETMLYKGILLSDYLSDFFIDLKDKRIETAICVFHQRFATNTLPKWHLAHPFQYVAHNGEVNTIDGNRNWVKARSTKFRNHLLQDLKLDIPLVDMHVSDSMSLDNLLEALVAGGMDLLQALRMMIPPAWQNNDIMSREIYYFHEYNSTKMEAWDGPAGIVVSDGRYAVCTLDRNGLRPAKWVLADDDTITLASEMGVRELPNKNILEKGRVEPGGMIAIDTHSGKIMQTEEIDTKLSKEHPYKEWISDNLNRLEGTLDDPDYVFHDMDSVKLKVYKKLFLFHNEEMEYVMRPLAETGQEAVAAMGDDIPIAVMSRKERLITDYFRQKFAQVTNPAIDPIRENVVMSLNTFIGDEENIFARTPQSANKLSLNSPVLSPYKFHYLETRSDMKAANIKASFTTEENLQTAIDRICEEAITAAQNGNKILIITDRYITDELLPIPMPLAVGAIHHTLIDKGLRCELSLVLETAYAREPHHYAVLIGVGANAIYPYFAYAVLEDALHNGMVKVMPARINRNYRRGIDKGLLKILSKMGISTIASYRGAQLFELLGVADDVVDKCFCGIVSRISGANFAFFDAEIRQISERAWNQLTPTSPGGMIKYVHNTETHSLDANLVDSLRMMVKEEDPATGKEEYLRYSDMVNSRQPMYLRDLLEIKKERKPIDIKKVEPASKIFPRFDTAAMSLGALSPEAHETLARAMNDLGGRSNSGEGGEDEERFNTLGNSKIKQIASGRFGVTPHYLVNAEVLQIKIAQGAKPGEGGQLPGGKVNELIARLRFSSPGITLISPPPHHDIYSIEDLAQLIYDLKEINPKAMVSVKLVSSPGVGIIAAGVAKCRADMITISGHDGGTAASPLSSIRYAGSPWELGLAETHQSLQLNGFRGNVRLQTDGGIKTGLDVVKAALLGAESFGFGTTPMIAMGCKFLRLCHLNNCPTGVATQNKQLRYNHFKGNVEMVKRFFHFIAEEIREHLADMGYRSMEEIIGRSDLLQQKKSDFAKHQLIDLSQIITQAKPPKGVEKDMPKFSSGDYNPVFRVGNLAARMKREIVPYIEESKSGKFNYSICNQDRAIGGELSGIIAEHYGARGLANQKLSLHFTGTAGQSFGAWNIQGMNLNLIGSANDYVGKGMAGGKIVISLQDNKNGKPLTLAGNTCLYGATGGKMYVSGRVGERFAVRNSGCLAIVEGAGDHCCEYMTGGCVVVLGPVGTNFGAGMTGGFAYVWDPERNFADNYNEELIEIDKITSEEMEGYRNHLRKLLNEFVADTSSSRVREMLMNFDDYLPRFWLVKPKASSAGFLLDNLESRAA